MPGWADLGGRAEAARQVMQANKGLPERLAAAEAALCEMRDTLTSINDGIGKLGESLGRSVRLSNKGQTRITLVGLKPVRVNDSEHVVAISAYVAGAPVAAPGISLVIDGDTGAPSPTFQQTLSGPVQSPGQIALLTDPGVPVIVDLLTSWVGGWEAR